LFENFLHFLGHITFKARCAASRFLVSTWSKKILLPDERQAFSAYRQNITCIWSGKVNTCEIASPKPKLTTNDKRRTIMNTKLVIAAAVMAGMLNACNAAPPMSPDRELAKSDSQSIVSQAQVFRGACDITASIEAFRAALGDLNPNQPGSFGAGRREINWDAVPAQFTNVDNFPGDFFNGAATPRSRGAVFSTPGSGFRVSDDNFDDLNGTYGDEFNFFSPVRTFIAVGSNVTNVDFFVPGSSTPATSTGFGVVFSDIDHPGSGMLRLFDAAGRSLGTFLAPACPEGFSFVGVMYPEPIVASVEIVSGQAALGPESFDVSNHDHGPIRDLVIMDDFLYGEPRAISAGGTERVAVTPHVMP
jgi:hypothetical protein